MNPFDGRPSSPTSASPRPRLICRIARRWSDLRGGAASRHLAKCPSCQEHQHAIASLERALRDQAADVRREIPAPSDTFEARLLRSVREQSSAARSGSRLPAWRGLWALGGMAAAAALVVLVVNGPRRASVSEHTPARNNSTAADAAVMAETVEALSDRFVSEMIPSAGALVAQNPLQQEMGLVYSDVRSALDFLALNFLPTTTTRPAPQGRTI